MVRDVIESAQQEDYTNGEYDYDESVSKEDINWAIDFLNKICDAINEEGSNHVADCSAPWKQKKILFSISERDSIDYLDNALDEISDGDD